MSYKKLLMALVLVLSLTSCQVQDDIKPKQAEVKETTETNTDLKKYSAVFYDYFDTVTEFLVYANDEKEFDQYKEILEKDDLLNQEKNPKIEFFSTNDIEKFKATVKNVIDTENEETFEEIKL